MTKFRLLGLSVMALAMVALVDCKGNKNGGDESSLSDTLAAVDPFGMPMSEDAPEGVDADTASQAAVYTENENGSVQAATPEQLEGNGNFYIVAGSFTVYKNAQKLNEDLKAKGYESTILAPYGQYNRVTVQRFNTVEEARAALPGLRGKIQQTLWILTR